MRLETITHPIVCVLFWTLVGTHGYTQLTISGFEIEEKWQKEASAQHEIVTAQLQDFGNEVEVLEVFPTSAIVANSDGERMEVKKNNPLVVEGDEWTLKVKNGEIRFHERQH